MIRVLFVANAYAPLLEGGAERAARRQVEQLRNAGHEVTVLTTDGTTSIRPVARARPGAEGVLEFPSPNVYHVSSRPKHRWTRPIWAACDLVNPVSARLVAAVADRVRPDVVVTSNLWSISTSVWRPLAERAPLLHVLHDGSTVCQTGYFDHGGRDCFGTLQPCRALLAVRRHQSAAVTSVIAPSQFLLDTATRAGLFQRARAVQVPNPAPVLPPPVERPGGRGPLSVAFVGNIQRYKGFDVLLEACRTSAVAVLHVVGSGDEALLIQARDQLGSRLILHGRVPSQRVAEILERCDALVMPSSCHENMPTVLLEGQAAGLAVISTRSGGAPEVIVEGVDGLIVERRATAQLRSALERLAGDPDLRLRMGVAARATAAHRAAAEDRFVPTVESCR